MSNTTPALTTSNNGRETNGRFATGNPGGPGNPFARKTAALRQALTNAVTDQDIVDIATILIFNAKAGHLPSVKLLFQYILGKPETVVNPDTLDLKELLLMQAASLSTENLNEFMGKIPPELALVILREFLPVMTRRLAESITNPLPPDEDEEDDEDEVPTPQVENTSTRVPSPNGSNGRCDAKPNYKAPSLNGSNGAAAAEEDDEAPSTNGVFTALDRLMRLFPRRNGDQIA